MTYNPDSERTPTLVERDDWGAQPPKRPIENVEIPSSYGFLTYASAVPLCKDLNQCNEAVRELQKYHMDHGAPDLPYNFMFCGNKVYEGRGWFHRVPPPPSYPQAEGKCHVFAFVGPMIEDYQERLRFFRYAYQIINYGVDNDYIVLENWTYRHEEEDWNVYPDKHDKA